MIRREVGNEFFLIAQHDHAILAGQLAQDFGNERFARPQPWEPVIAAVRMHDCGWPLHDDQPTLNPSHSPLDVFESPRSIALKVWAASAERVAAVHPYSGLLVSLHSLALSILATSQSNPQHEKFDTVQLTERFEINKFQHREVERQEQLRLKLGLRTDLPLTHGLAAPRSTEADDQLIFNFRLLQAMDLLSLCLCCTHPPAEKTHDVLTDPGAPAVQLKIVRQSDEMLRVDPWPFAPGRIDLSIPVRRIPRREFRDEADLREAIKAAPILQLPFAVGAGIMAARFHALVAKGIMMPMKLRSVLFLSLLATLTGCFSHTETYQISAQNKLNRPVTIWLVKEDGPAEAGWLSPEQVAETNPVTDDQLPDVVVPPDKTARIGPLEGSFYARSRAALRIYGGTPTLTQMLAAGRGGLNRYDLILLPGINNLQIVERTDGGISAIRVAATQP